MTTSNTEQRRVAIGADTLTALYREHLPSVYGYLLRLSGGKVRQAEDLTQDVFVQLVDALRAGRSECADRRWLMTVARSRFVDQVRRERLAEARLALVHRSVEPPTTDPEPHEILDHLADLPPMYRLALVLRYLDDLSVPEVAGVLGRNMTATNSLLARARNELRRVNQGGPDA